MIRRGRPVAALAAALLVAAFAARAEKAGWTIDPKRTHIGFVIDAVGFPRTEGEFRNFKGRLDVDFERPAKSRVAFTVEAASIDVGSSSFDDTLRGPAFLDAARFPQLSFASTAVEKVDETHARVLGDMTILGVTQSLEVAVEVRRPPGGGRLAFVARAHIDRLAFGMNSGFPVISRDVDLTVASEVEAK